MEIRAEFKKTEWGNRQCLTTCPHNYRRTSWQYNAPMVGSCACSECEYFAGSRGINNNIVLCNKDPEAHHETHR